MFVFVLCRWCGLLRCALNSIRLCRSAVNARARIERVWKCLRHGAPVCWKVARLQLKVLAGDASKAELSRQIFAPTRNVIDHHRLNLQRLCLLSRSTRASTLSACLSLRHCAMQCIPRSSKQLVPSIRSLATGSRSYAVQAPGAPTFNVFDRNVKYLQKERAASNVELSRQVDYLRDEVATRLCERLLVGCSSTRTSRPL